jgi:diguanylate cyclase (GGDEF)-like protein/PAS domain S-box-containing protein
MLREELVKNVAAQASVIASISSRELLSNHRAEAEKTVKALANIDSIEFAGIFDKEGRNFALYVRPGVTMPSHRHQSIKSEYHIHTATYIEIVIPVLFKQQQIGMIHVRSSMAPVYEKLEWNIFIAVVAATVAFVTAVLMIFSLLPAITDPLQYLITLMKRVSRENDFTLRSTLHRSDEIGTLSEGFNAMLEQIQTRDVQLARHQKNLEREVAQRTAKLTEAQRIAHLGNWEWDILNNTLEWSDEIYRIFGFTPQQFGATYESFLQAVHPEDREAVKINVRESLEQGRPYTIDHRILLPDGKVRYVHEQGEISRNQEGHPIVMQGTVQDITESKQAEMALKDANEQLSVLLNSLPIAVYRCQAQGEFPVIYMSQNVTSFTAYDPKDFIETTDLWFTHIHPDDLSKVSEGMDILFDKGVHTYEYRWCKADGTYIWIQDSLKLIHDADERPDYMVGMWQDITERKHIEEEISLMATTDALTGIANRRELNRQLEKEIERSKRYGVPLSLIMYDIDYFKRVNDTFGHDAGDRVLQTLTALVKSNIRTVDIVARWGGEEFMILMPQSDAEAAGDAAEKLRQKIVEHPFEQVGNLTVSFGVTAFTSDDDLNVFLKRVDDALYHAKENGRNRVEILL